MSFTLRVHRYEVNAQTAERELVEYRPLLRLGCSSPDGYSGEILYLQGGCVYGEGGAAYETDDLPAWFAGAVAAVHPQALADVGFTPDVVQMYCTNGAEEEVEYVQSLPRTGYGDEDWPQHATDPPQPGYPPGFKPELWVLGFLCVKQHDYQGTGQSRYNRQMRCVDCRLEQQRSRTHKKKPQGAPSG